MNQRALEIFLENKDIDSELASFVQSGMTARAGGWLLERLSALAIQAQAQAEKEAESNETDCFDEAELREGA